MLHEYIIKMCAAYKEDVTLHTQKSAIVDVLNQSRYTCVLQKYLLARLVSDELSASPH